MLPGNMMLIAIYYHIILILGDTVLLGGLQLRYEFLEVYVYGVDKKYVE